MPVRQQMNDITLLCESIQRSNEIKVSRNSDILTRPDFTRGADVQDHAFILVLLLKVLKQRAHLHRQAAIWRWIGPDKKNFDLRGPSRDHGMFPSTGGYLPTQG